MSVECLSTLIIDYKVMLIIYPRINYLLMYGTMRNFVF